jgi:hypothetical protein
MDENSPVLIGSQDLTVENRNKATENKSSYTLRENRRPERSGAVVRHEGRAKHFCPLWPIIEQAP